MMHIFLKDNTRVCMRVKIFVLIAILFSVTIFGIVGLRYIEIEKAIRGSTEEIGAFVKKLDFDKRHDILEYLNISMIQMDSQIQAIFNKIGELKWVEDRLLPGNYSQYANHFEESTKLLLNNTWIDLIQTTDGDKLASSIVVRPPNLESYTFIPVDSTLKVIVTRNKSGSAIAYIGVPYWKDAGSNKNEEFLLFTVSDLLEIDPSNLSVKKTNWKTNPLDSYAVIGHVEYMQLMSNAIESIKIVQQKLKENEDLISILMNEVSLEKWIHGKLYKKTSENALKDAWSLRYEQNQLIWEIGQLFGSGIWNFNPLEKLAPKGLCSLKKSDLLVDSDSYPVVGILMNEIVQKDLIPFSHKCDPKGEDFCFEESSQVVSIENKNGVYFTKTMVFNSFDNALNQFEYGTLTLGISMNQMLRQLAFVIPGNILFVSDSGKQVFFQQNGVISDEADWSGINFFDLVHEKSGVIKNIQGKEFLFVHLGGIIEDGTQVFVLELRQNVFQMLMNLNTEAALLLKRLFLENICLGFLAILITLLALNHILKRGIAPLSDLAETTKLVAAGHLEGVHIPERYKKRSDEIGILCGAFDQMVLEMREGVKVRALLDKVVSKEIANKILRDGVQLGGEVREVTILFADIRNFTQISEKLPPHEVLEMLNSCLTVLSKVVDEHRGVIDKYIGDEIMAIFGAPVDTETPAFEAVMCAKIMIDVLREWNVARESRKLLPLSIGISIHTGQVIAGNIGADNHLSYTVLGHNVNLASRIADHAKGMEILITEETLQSPKVFENVSVDPLSPVEFKGISKPIRLFRVVV